MLEQLASIEHFHQVHLVGCSRKCRMPVGSTPPTCGCRRTAAVAVLVLPAFAAPPSLVRTAGLIALLAPAYGTESLKPTRPWPQSVYRYRGMLRGFSKDTAAWATSARSMRSWMANEDPDVPLYHLTAPEGWVNDPNGVTYDHRTGLYHRMYQYMKTYAGPEEQGTCWGENTGNTGCETYNYRGHAYAGCAEGPPWCINASDPSKFDTSSATGMPTWNATPGVSLSARTRIWKAMGHAVSRDLATWEDWPGIDPDSPFDLCGVDSGNCVLVDQTDNHYEPGKGGVLCIYSGATCGMKLREPNGNSAGVCAYSSDWVRWHKTGCITKAPSPLSQTSHDMSIFRDGPTWYVLSGGCTYDGGNTPTGADPRCTGNAQVWSSSDLVNFSYVQPLSPLGGPGSYWELPYLLPFDHVGQPLRNDQMAMAEQTALLVGLGGGGANAAWIGVWNKHTARFLPEGTNPSSLDPWPARQAIDTGDYYSFNAHATDSRGDTYPNTTRRLMYGWVYPVRMPGRSSAMTFSSSAQVQEKVPYWVGGHSLARLLTLAADKGAHKLVQTVAPEIEKLRRGMPYRLSGPTVLAANSVGNLPGLVGDALDITVRFRIREGTSGLVGLLLRCVLTDTRQQMCIAATYDLVAGSLCAGWRPAGTNDSSVLIGRRCTAGNVLPLQKSGSDDILELRTFLDRSFLEVYTNGAALTKLCMLTDSVPLGAPKRATADLLFQPTPGANGTNGTGSVQLVKFEAYTMGSMWGVVDS